MSGLFGVDGCREGWIAASRTGAGNLALRRISALTELGDARVIAIDTPIGLVEAGQRECDQQARRALGRRSSCVFTAPIRPFLDATTYGEACAIGRSAPGNHGKALSKQAWNIMPKVRGIDHLLQSTPALRRVVYEVHPEVTFLELSGGVSLLSKKTPAGRASRSALLAEPFGVGVLAATDRRRELRCEADDILDAIVALWTAERIAAGTARSLPAEPPTDRCGLPMRIMI